LETAGNRFRIVGHSSFYALDNTHVWKARGENFTPGLFADPDWLFWAVQEGVFEQRVEVRDEAEEVYRKARSIKIPQPGSSWVKAYCHFDDLSFMGLTAPW